MPDARDGELTPLKPTRDEVGTVLTRSSGSRFEILVVGTARFDPPNRSSAIQRFDPELRHLGEIPLSRGVRPNLLVLDEPRLIVPYSEEYLIQIITGSNSEEIRVLGAVGKFTADVFPLADGSLTVSSNEHFFYVEPPPGGRRSTRRLLPSTRFLTQRNWITTMSNGHRPLPHDHRGCPEEILIFKLWR